MSWITITEAKFLEQITGAEASAIKTAALATGQGEPLTNTIAKVVQEVRGYVAANAANRLDNERDTIPQELEADAIAIIRYRALNRLPVKSLLTPTRQDEYKDALRKLEATAAGKFSVEQPSTASDQVTSSGSSAQVVSSTTRTATRAKLSGL